MKKFLAVLFMILLTSTQSVFAYQEIRFNNAGIPLNGPKSLSAQFGKNAPVGTPAYNAYRNTHYPRHYIRRKAMTHNCRRQYMMCGKCPCPNNYGGPAYAQSGSTASENQISRFDKRYTAKTPKSYTKNGITFYN